MINRSARISVDLDRLRRFLSEAVEHFQSTKIAGQPVDPEDVAALQGITVRAVYYELAAIVEHELQRALMKTPHKLRNPSDVPWELDRRKIRRRVESAYHVELQSLPGSAVTEQVQRTADALKHRRGLKSHARGDNPDSFPEFYEPQLEHARNAIAEVQSFLAALWTIAHEKAQGACTGADHMRTQG